MLIGHRDYQAGEGITNKVGTVAQGGESPQLGVIFPIATTTLKVFDGLIDAFPLADISSSTLYSVIDREKGIRRESR